MIHARAMGRAAHTRRFGRKALRAIGASAVLTFLLGVTAAAVIAGPGDPSGVSFTLEGCRNDGTITLPSGGKYVCPDSAYTTGNLGKGWNELDLVPFRITAKAGNSAPDSQTYKVAIALDNFDAGAPGFDVIGSDGADRAPVLNTALSDATCTALTSSGQLTLSPGVGGIDTSIYRTLTITQPTKTTCVYDWYGRLALGSHLFPGASLHANLLNQSLGTQGIGAKDVSIPVKEIQPQSLDKNMKATQGTDHVWDVTKNATPATLSFPDTCAAGGTDPKGLSLTVTWTKGPADPSGPITVITHVYATNPAARTITTNVTDVIYSGTTALNSANSGDVNVPANTANFEVLSHTFVAPDGTTDLNDTATATYKDLVTGVPVPGQTTAVASADVELTGSELNQSATINDVEGITGTGLTFSADSFSPSIGAFDSGYVAGTKTIGPVSWTSTSQSDSGSVTFSKKVYVTEPSEVTGKLSDKATLTGSDGASADADLDVNISTHAKVSLTINKSIDVAQAADTSFTFNILDGTTPVGTATVTIKAGDKTGSTIVSDLKPGVTYTIDEVDQTGWKPNDSQTATVTLPSCANSVDFANVSAKDLTVSKTAVPSFTRAFGWDIAKSVDNKQKYTAGGAPATFDYTVKVTHDGGTDSLWAVDGVITVSNPNWMDIVADVSDSLPDAKCSVTDGTDVTVPAGGSADVKYSCAYDSQPAYDTDLTNTATATWDQATYGTPSGSASHDEKFQFTDPTALVDESVDVTDSLYGNLGTVSYTDPSPKTFTYSMKFEDPAGTCTSHDNTASFETNDLGLTDSSSVTVTDCQGADLTVTKTATPTFTRTYTWGITKTVDNKQKYTAGGAPATFDYTVKVTHDNGIDSAWKVTGKITVSNPNDWEDITLTSLADAVDNGGACTLDPGPYVIPKSGSLDVNYSCTYATAPSSYSGTNTATATWDNTAYSTPTGLASGGAAVAFTTPSTIVDESVDVTDSLYGNLGTVSYTDPSPKTFTYSMKFEDPAGTCTSHDNTASFETNDLGLTDSSSVTVTDCQGADLTVTKTATPTFTRTYSWGITKTVDKTTVDLSGTNPQSATFNYTVKVTHDGGTDSAWALSGTITVTNPNDWEDITLTTLTDTLDKGGTCAITEPVPYVIAKSSAATFHYTCSSLDGTSTKNTATATWDSGDYSTPHGSASSSASAVFATPTTIVDGSVTVTDTNAVTPTNTTGKLGTMAYTDPSPKSFTYSRTITGTPGKCVSYDNTATFTTNTTGTTGSASQTVEVCASVLNVKKLTQGAVDPTKTWNFNLYSGPNANNPSSSFPSVLASDTSLNKADGVMTFGNYNLDPNKTYTFCEINAPAGWASIWTFNGNNLLPYNPDRFSTSSFPNGQDLGVRCFDFGAGTAYLIPKGGTITFQVDNRYPGGEPRTIGYWKNWSSCTGGGQAKNALAQGGKDAGYWLIDDVLNAPGITIGNFTIPAAQTKLTVGKYTKTGCEIAVSLLGKSDWGTGKQMSSDAAYGLAAQLIAAKANITAGAKSCTALGTAVLGADTLLAKYNFNGLGSYLDSKVTGTKLTDRNAALSLANTLDQYNNGKLCP